MIKENIVVVGAQWGDEGKGRIIDLLSEKFKDKGFTKVVGTEARGFLFGAPLALALGVGFVPVRKPGKLPRATFEQSYQLEYGIDSLEIHQDALTEDDNVLIIDDLLATGGTIGATTQLIRRVGAKASQAAFVISLPDLGGEKRLAALGGHRLGALHRLQTLDRGPDQVDRRVRTDTIGQHVGHNSRFQHGAHGATGNHARTLGGRLHVDLGRSVGRLDRVLDRAVVQLYRDHVAARRFHGLLDSNRHFARLAAAEANLAIAITNHSQCREAENTTPFTTLATRRTLMSCSRLSSTGSRSFRLFLF